MKNEWINSRRSFVKALLLAGVATQLPWIQSCTHKEQSIDIPDNIEPLSLKNFLNLHTLMDILFPEDGNGPGAIKVKADHYFLWLLNDLNLDSLSRSFLLDNLVKLNDDCIRSTGYDFHALSRFDQEDFIAEISELKWGESWLSRLLTLIFEALFLDSQYGVNPEGIAWKWLEYNPGYPRPKKELLYPTILNKKHEI